MRTSKAPKQRPGDLFRRYGGRMTLPQIQQYLNRIPMRDIEREYFNRVIERYHNPVSPHITREEFQRAINEMLQNTKDPLEKSRLERIKKEFGL